MSQRSPLYDLAARIDPTVRASGDHIDEMKTLAGKTSTLPTVLACEFYLHWCQLACERADLVRQFALPEPFEPLIVMFERGDTIAVEDIFFDLGSMSVPYNKWLSEASNEALDMSERNLDWLDQANQIR